MFNVEIICIKGAVIIRARNSELFVLPNHTKALRTLSNGKDFADYFIKHALVNRSARKLFEAWLKKDHTIWQRLFDTIHSKIKDEDYEEDSDEMNNSFEAKGD